MYMSVALFLFGSTENNAYWILQVTAADILLIRYVRRRVLLKIYECFIRMQNMIIYTLEMMKKAFKFCIVLLNFVMRNENLLLCSIGQFHIFL